MKKHIKPISKAVAGTDVVSIISLVVSILTALAPIVTLIVDSAEGKEKES